MTDVVHQMNAFLIVALDWKLRLGTTWRWSRDDPAVVKMAIHHPHAPESDVEIPLSRENLVKASIDREKAGMGDCVIEPTSSFLAGDLLLFHLAAFEEDGTRLEGHQHILMSNHSVAKMMRLTLEIVPQEFETYDMDRLIEGWLQ